MTRRKSFAALGTIATMMIAAPGTSMPATGAGGTDFGRVYQAAAVRDVALPSSTQEAAAVIEKASSEKRPMRFSGHRHSQNGTALPRAGELLISTEKLNTLSFVAADAIEVGAGVVLDDLQGALRPYALQIPIANGGGRGPTVGGFIAAGGMSQSSDPRGGFWANVFEVTMVTARGAVVTLRPEDEDFKWLFGSMGQLGLVTKARLRVESFKNDAPSPPPGEIRIQPGSGEPATLYWVNVIVPPDKQAAARHDLEQLAKQYGPAFASLAPYEWRVRFRRFNPPLVYPLEGDFVLLGIFGPPKPGTSVKRFLDLNAEFARIVKTKGYHRYIQAELKNRDTDFRDYFDARVWRQFVALKRKYDPEGLFNRGVVP